MKVLLDACVWGGATDVLTTAGHDVEAVAHWPQDPGDREILNRAVHASQVIVTIDKDFGELAVVHRLPHRASCVSSASLLNDTERLPLRSSRSTARS